MLKREIMKEYIYKSGTDLSYGDIVYHSVRWYSDGGELLIETEHKPRVYSRELDSPSDMLSDLTEGKCSLTTWRVGMWGIGK